MLKDLRHACRMVRQNPGFALTAIVSIALGIGANSAIFSFQDGILLRPLAIADPARVLTVDSRSPIGNFEGFSYPDFEELRDRNRSFDGLVAYRLITAGIAQNERTQPQFEIGFLVSGNFFDVLGVTPHLGRAFRPDEDRVVGSDPAVILAYDYWQTEFAGDPSVVGRRVRIGKSGGLEFAVIGVAPEAFTGMDLFIRPAFYIPAHTGPEVLPEGDAVLQSRTVGASDSSFHIKGRLKTGVSIASADADVAAIARGLAESYPESNRGRSAAVRTERQSRLDASPLLQGIVAAVGGLMVIILLIACANVMNLMLSRGRARAREIAIRLSVGATRPQLLRHLMMESVVIAIAGGALGLLIAQGGIEFFSRSLELPGDAPIKFSFQLDSRVLLFTLTVSALSAMLFGLVPALRSVKRDLTGALKAGELESVRSRYWGRYVLVAIQIAGSIVLVMASAQMYRNTLKVLRENPGFNIDHRLTVRLDPSVAGYTAQQTDVFYRTLLERTGELQGVRSAALSHALPFTTDGIGVGVVPDGYEFPVGQHSAGVGANIVDEHFFETLGIRLNAGRGFRDSDRSASPKVAVVNDSFAQRFFKGDAIGRRVRIEQINESAEIVGVTANAKFNTPVQREAPFIFVPFHQAPRSRMTLIIETSGDPAAMTAAIRETIRSIDPNMPIFSVRTFDNIFERGPAAQLRLFNGVFGATGVMGFFLALVGLYAVVAQQVARRTREIGVRMALGAERRQVMQMILKQTGIVAGIGIVIGLVLSVAARSALLTALGQRTSSFDPLVLGLLPLGILVVTLFAAAIPARRASLIDPIAALRQD